MIRCVAPTVLPGAFINQLHPSLRVAVPFPRQGETKARQLASLASVSPSGEGTATRRLTPPKPSHILLQRERERERERERGRAGGKGTFLSFFRHFCNTKGHFCNVTGTFVTVQGILVTFRALL